MKIPFVSFIPLEKELDKDLRAAFDRVLARSWYIEGEEDKAFEQAFADYCGVKYAVGTGNGLDALMLALKALEIGEGDEVIVPSNTYIATALAVTYVGAKPVFVEPDINTFNIDPALIEEKITSATKAIMPVHLYGQACDMDPVMEIAGTRSLCNRGLRSGTWRHIQRKKSRNVRRCRRIQFLSRKESRSARRCGSNSYK